MATLDERVAALEARLGAPGVDPRVLTPPITIGELTNVPAPGSQLAAQWAQDISSRVVQRFPSVAPLKAWAAPVGAFAVAVDTGVLWRRVAAGWAQQTPWTTSVGGIATVVQGFTTLATINVPADPGPRIITASCLLRIDRYGPAPQTSAYIIVDGTIHAETDFLPQADTAGINGTNIPCWVSMIASMPANSAGSAVVFQLGTNSNGQLTGGWKIYADPKVNRLDVTVMPRGY